MGIPQIPGVSTSVIDRSSTEVSLKGGRVPYLVGFSKFGNGTRYYTTPKELEYYLGKVDTNKYGLAMEYAKDAFMVTDKVMFTRLVSPLAAYSNYCISIDALKREPAPYNQIIDEALSNTDINKVIKTNTFSGINTKDEFRMEIDNNYNDTSNNKKISFSILAQAPGVGYNDLFSTFSPAIDYEKLDANREGETNYKFNFIRSEIFEDSSSIVKSLGSPFVFSLIDQDEDTGKIISDMYNGEELFINAVTKIKNSFLTYAIDTDDDYDISEIRTEMRKYATIDKLNEKMGQSGRLLFTIDGKKYEITCTASIVAQADGTQKMVFQPKKTIKPDSMPMNQMNQYITFMDNSATQQFAKLKWSIDATTGVAGIGYDIVANPDTTGTITIPSVRYLDGDDAYYQISINTDGEVVFNQVGFLRWYVYNYLLTHNIRMISGSDDTSTTEKDAMFNSAGYLKLPYYTTECKARDLLVEHFNTNTELREVLYPKWDFDYVPDWTCNVDVGNAIMQFGDSIGLTMPLVSLPPLTYNIGTNSDNDKAALADAEVRNSVLAQSTYNTMLTGSQINKMHISNSTGQRLRMPASYYHMLAHLAIDRDYSITEPVANMIKGILRGASKINLAYSPTSEKIEVLRKLQINSIIDEPDGTYFIDQLTAYKKASKLSRANVVKVIHRMRKDLPKLLKDLVQSKETSDVIATALNRAYEYLGKYLVSPENYKDGIFRTINVQAVYNADTYTLRLGVTVNPIGTIEIIDIPIIVI
jgi:hypothetical protein